MPIALGLLAIAVAAQGGPEDRAVSRPAAEAGRPAISYEVRDVTMPGPGWRGAMATRFVPVARDGGNAVWTADHATFAAFLRLCRADPECQVLQAPDVTAPAGKTARLAHESSRRYVADLKRRGDGPPRQASSVSFEPEYAEVRDGVRVHLTSERVTPLGLVARVAVEESRFVAFHPAVVTEELKSDAPAVPDSSANAPLLNRLFHDNASGKPSVSATIQVPEVVTSRVEGTWLIPEEGALVVSLGPRTRKDPSGKVSTEERLVLIGFHTTPGSPTTLPPRS